jgi:S-adenosylmethionine decarboxylase
MQKSWGYHLMLDCAECNDGIKSKENIKNFVQELIKQIDMVAHGEPVIEYLLPNEPNAGYSMMQLITTSNICAHFMENDYTAYFDIFSCKEYNIETAKEVVREFFGAKQMKSHFIERQA